MNKCKGQISFDLIFSLIALMVFLQFMSAFTSDLLENQNKVIVRDQAMTMAIQVKDSINACNLLQNSSTSVKPSIQTVLPLIHEIGGKSDCTVKVNESNNKKIVVNHLMKNGLNESVELSIPEFNSTQSIEVKCGEKLSIEC